MITITTKDIRALGPEARDTLVSWMNEEKLNPFEACQITVDVDSATVAVLEYKTDESGKKYLLADQNVAVRLVTYQDVNFTTEMLNLLEGL